MAGRADKKRDIELAQYNKMMNIIIFIVNFLYIAFYIKAHIEEDLTNWDVVGFVFMTFITFFTNGMIKHAISLGTPYSYYGDILYINLFVQFLVSFSRKAWWIYTVIPLYIFYILGGYCC